MKHPLKSHLKCLAAQPGMMLFYTLALAGAVGGIEGYCEVRTRTDWTPKQKRKHARERAGMAMGAMSLMGMTMMPALANQPVFYLNADHKLTTNFAEAV